jgi:hypothetical protein
MSFNDFEQLVDSSVKKISGKRKSVEEFGEPYFENEDVKIFLGDTKQKCIEYGQTGKYGFCISRLDSSNLFHGYRSHGATFYFLYFKQEQENAPEGFIVIHTYPYNEYQINYASENVDFTKTKEEIIKEFPVLNGLFENVIVHKLLSEKEKEMYNYVQSKPFIHLKTLEHKLMFIELGKPIPDLGWSLIIDSSITSEQEAKKIIKKYIEVGSYDLPEEVLEAYPKFENRYIQKLKQRIEVKLDNDMYGFTHAEAKYFPENLKPLLKRSYNDGDYFDYYINGSSIQDIENPSLEVQLIAVSQNGLAIRYIDGPSEDVQLTAVEKNESAIKYIDNPIEDAQLAAVQQDGMLIKVIMKKGIIPSPEVKLAAVKQNYEAIQFINDPSEKIQLAAIEKNIKALIHIANPTENAKLAALKKDGIAIRYMNNPSEEIQLAAVETDGLVIGLISNKGIEPSPKVKLTAVKSNPGAIKYIKNPTPEVIEYMKTIDWI